MGSREIPFFSLPSAEFVSSCRVSHRRWLGTADRSHRPHKRLQPGTSEGGLCYSCCFLGTCALTCTPGGKTEVRHPGVPRSSRTLGVPRGIPDRRVPRGTQGYPGVSRGTRGAPGYLGVPRGAPGYPGVPRGTPGTNSRRHLLDSGSGPPPRPAKWLFCETL
jgi:hypothetical protein